MRVFQNDLEHGDTETQRFYFISLIYKYIFLCIFVSLCFISQLRYTRFLFCFYKFFNHGNETFAVGVTLMLSYAENLTESLEGGRLFSGQHMK